MILITTLHILLILYSYVFHLFDLIYTHNNLQGKHCPHLESETMRSKEGNLPVQRQEDAT